MFDGIVADNGFKTALVPAKTRYAVGVNNKMTELYGFVVKNTVKIRIIELCASDTGTVLDKQLIAWIK